MNLIEENVKTGETQATDSIKTSVLEAEPETTLRFYRASGNPQINPLDKEPFAEIEVNQ